MTNWIPGLVVLAGGAVSAGAYLMLNRRPGARPGPKAEDPAAADLEIRAGQLIEELRELELNRHQLTPERLAEERGRLEREAAAALRARDERLKVAKAAPPTGGRPGKPKKGEPAPAPAGFFGRHPELKGALWGAGAVAFIALAGLWLVENQKPPRDAGGMGDEQQAAQPAEDDAEFQDALARARQDPQDVDLGASVVHELIQRQEYAEADALTERALGIDPFHLENRVHRAVLKAARGDAKAALADLQHLADTYPNANEAVLFTGALAMQLGDKQLALDALERFAARARPDERPAQLLDTIRSLRAELGAP